MFVSLLLITFLISLAVSTVIALLFARPVKRIMYRIIPDDISGAWVRYLLFAIYVVGVAGGVQKEDPNVTKVLETIYWR